MIHYNIMKYMYFLTDMGHVLLIEFQVNPNIKFEVFIHKVDGLSDDHKIGKKLISVTVA